MGSVFINKHGMVAIPISIVSVHDSVGYHNLAIALSTGCASYAHHSIIGSLFVQRMSARSTVVIVRQKSRQGPSTVAAISYLSLR